MKTLYGAYVQLVACGYGMTLMIVRADSEEDQAAIEKMPIFDGPGSS